ncbi:hypothetical protein S83_063271 [Arachis hypogaea]
MPASFNDHHNWFESSLQSVSESAEMLYTYKHVVHGFSTRLTNQEAEALSKQPGILSLIPKCKYELHATRTPYFLGLDLTLASLDRFSTHLPASVAESEVIIGVVDIEASKDEEPKRTCRVTGLGGDDGGPGLGGDDGGRSGVAEDLGRRRR